MTLSRTRGSKRSTPARSLWLVRPRLVALEDRTVPATFAWNVDADGDWTNPANWFNQTTGTAADGFPNAPADFAILGSKITANRTVTIPDGVTITVNGLRLADNDQYTVAAAGTGNLVFDTTDGAATLEVTAASHTLAAPVTLAKELVAVPTVGTTITVSGQIAESGGPQAFTLNSPGTVVFSQTGGNTYTGPTTVKDGTLQLAATGAGDAIIGPLTVGDGSGGAGTAVLVAVNPDQIADDVDVVVNLDGLLALGAAPETVRSLTVNPGGSVVAQLLTVTDGATIVGTNKDDVFAITDAAGVTSGKLNDVEIGAIKGSVTFNAKGGTDTVVGPDTGATFALTGADTGTVNGTFSFTSVEQLTGGAGDDTFAPTEGKTFAGTIDGGGGTNTLDYSKSTTGVVVNLGASSPEFVGTLQGDQETPPVVTKAGGTVSVTNYNPATNTFDIVVTTTDLDLSKVVGFHIHVGPVGVAGPIIIDLQKLAPLTPDGTGFKFAATGVTLPAEHQAAFLGGITYVNIHTPENKAGEIRAQLFPANPFVDVPGMATGVTNLVNIASVIGSEQNDSIVGNNGVNLLVGRGGNDVLVGAKGNDIVQGGTGDDILVWSNGDNTDVMDGGAGNDLVVVNGAVGKGDDFTITANGTRLAFERTNLVGFKLDIGTVETLTVNGIGGDDKFTLGDLAGVADLKTVNLNGFDGNDTIIGPDVATTYNVTGPTVGRGTIADGEPVSAKFSQVENLIGGAKDDTFAFADGATIAGTIDGGGGTNTLDYSKSTTGVVVNLGVNAPGLAGTLQPDQEVPAQISGANGTFAITNFDPATNKFDISVTVTGLAPADVIGFHIHVGPVGVNGPIIVDLQPLATLVPDGTGFKFTATGVQLPPEHQAALLGGITYVNIHTPTAKGGLIRGQAFPTGVFVDAPGAATGTGGVVNIANVTGGMAGDSIVGNNGVNVLIGGGGNDILVGAKGNDVVQGGDGDDILVWSNGDNTDVMDGGAGKDTVVVNGSFDKGDEFTVSAKGTRVNFQRTNLVPFALDIGTVETLTVNGIGGDDKFTVNNLAGVADLTAVNLFGLDGSDTFTVTPSPTVAVNVDGGQPAPPADPGDTLTVNTAGTTGVVAAGTKTDSGLRGQVTFADRGTVGFAGIETLAGVTLVSPDLTNPFAVGPDVGGGTSVQLYGLNGKPLGSAIQAFGANVTGGVRVAVADVNGDGTADLIVGAGPGSLPTVRVFDGKTQQIILEFNAFEATFTGGVYVAAADFNADGKADLIITPDEGGGPRVRILDGAAASAGNIVALTDFFGIGDPNFRGGARASAGDVNADGIPDLVVAAGFQGGPRVAAFNGKTLFDPLPAVVGAQPPKLFNDFFAFEQTLRNGVFITVGDINGDGFAELIAGGGPGGGPRVTAFSGKDLVTSGGATLTQVANFFAGDPANRGGIRLTVRDIDGDNRADIIAGAGTGGGSRVTAYAAATIPAQGDPPVAFAFDAIPGFFGGVFVG